MIIVCSNCSTSLQLADDKIPKHSFSLRCPKCQGIINNPMPAGPAEPSALTGGASMPPPDSANNRYAPAPPYGTRPPLPDASSTAGSPDVLRQLLELLQQGRLSEDAGKPRGLRHALVCVAAPRRATAAKMLVEMGYQVYLAESCAQAADRIKGEQIHIILLDTEFAFDENGHRFMMQEVQRLRAAQRRRLLVVKLAPDARTLDYHAAFLQSVNLLVNTLELNALPDALESALRHHNELYKDFYEALQVEPM